MSEASTPNQLVARFVKEKETKGSVRYSEYYPGGMINSLYVNKFALVNLCPEQYPEKLEVVITVIEEK
jgi:hypothetical protein